MLLRNRMLRIFKCKLLFFFNNLSSPLFSTEILDFRWQKLWDEIPVPWIQPCWSLCKGDQSHCVISMGTGFRGAAKAELLLNFAEERNTVSKPVQ